MSKMEKYYEEWIEENGIALYNYIFKQIRHKEISEDIYQEVLISAYLALSSFENRSTLKTWLYRIAMNKCRDYWRQESSRQRNWEEQLYIYEERTPYLEPEEFLLHQSARQMMWDALNELPHMYREPLVLYYYQDHTLKDISTYSQIPLSTVKTRMRRAKEKLKEKDDLLVAQ